MIHFALQNWEAHRHWYEEWRKSTIKKNSHYWYISHPWKNLKPTQSPVDYVKDIQDNIMANLKKFDTVQKKNWLHPDTDLFSKDHDKNIDFGFLLAI